MQTPLELEVTNLTPSPVVTLTVATKPPPKVPPVGRLLMVGEVDGALATVAVVSEPELPL